MGGLRFFYSENQYGKGPITTEELYFLLRESHIGVDKLPDLSIDLIADESKGDLFTKGLAVVQVLWLITTVLVRVLKQLALL